jgi:alkanesulfonate monooxygenase
MLAYSDLGVTTFLIRGFNPLQDAIEYGREIIPRVRAEIARRDASYSKQGNNITAIAG